MIVSYQSDMAKNGNLSAKYTNVSDTEAKKILKVIEKKKMKIHIIISILMII